ASKEHGGGVRKGERGTFVVFFKPLVVKDQDAPNGVRTIPFLRHFHVFNIEQADGLDLPALDTKRSEVPAIDAADAVLANYPDAPTVSHGGARACYSRTEDRVRMPERDAFESGTPYYLMLWHELTHSTRHE